MKKISPPVSINIFSVLTCYSVATSCYETYYKMSSMIESSHCACIICLFSAVKTIEVRLRKYWWNGIIVSQSKFYGGENTNLELDLCVLMKKFRVTYMCTHQTKRHPLGVYLQLLTRSDNCNTSKYCCPYIPR